MVDPLENITSNGLCLGCGACVASINRSDLRMALTEDGYLRPQSAAPLNDVEQNILNAVCVGRALSHESIDEDYHPLWGPIKWLGTGYAIDPDVRYRGSSGGVISAIAISLVERGEVDFVLATGADPSDPIGNYSGARNDRTEIIHAAGSRYAPSSPLAAIEQHLSAGRRFAFIGKPCDVAALRQMAKRDARVDALVPYMIAFFCAGVPSRKGTLKVLDALGVAHDDVEAFRYRGDGWPGLARARRHDGSEETMDYNSSWGNILNRHLQFRCKICPDGTGEFADIACADAWYGADGYPDFTEREGRSLVVARTKVGETLVKSLAQEKRIAVEPLAVDEIAKMQPYQVHRKRHIRARIAAMWLWRRRGPRYARLKLAQTARQTSILSQLRDFLGTLRRLPKRQTRLP
ncbi:Coenzyme F420 hydrogenase/dehydrogenase, beta subunit C-terminal domain [Sphingobium sp. H39-3-25]|uniref:Coenzyme F420 hydrogenase/dehydrogenase, beta subunit C-terminal domain n=1 Tax=Sphingobium arseniciresistens TaxID=3030834 RepID=UPI0023B9DF38|nr:Coenzyme F420 hydrogenase/dehydrogenase, beta subunit C-terminal domain [Sphingobium arseniciresistens]